MRNGHGGVLRGKARRTLAGNARSRVRRRKDTANAVFLTNTLAKRKVDVHNSSPQQRTFASLTKTPWGGSSAGRALRSQCRGREFDPPPLHHIRSPSGKARRASPFSAFEDFDGLRASSLLRAFPTPRGSSPALLRGGVAPARHQVRRSGAFLFPNLASLSVSVSVRSANIAEKPHGSCVLRPRYA